MATNWIFYPPHIEMFTATLTATTGTSSTLANLHEPHRFVRMDVDTVGTYVSGADEFMYRIDFGSGVTKTADFIALVNHNFYSETASLRVYVDSTDNASLTGPLQARASVAAVSTDEPIWVETVISGYTKRYWWPFFDSISANAYCGSLLLGVTVNPTVDPIWESLVEIDIESGRIVNTTPDGYNHKVRKHGIKYGWEVKYQFLSDADVATFKAWLAHADYVDTPFVFTDNGGTNYYYGELMGNPQFTPVQAGLTDLSFFISEVIA